MGNCTWILVEVLLLWNKDEIETRRNSPLLFLLIFGDYMYVRYKKKVITCSTNFPIWKCVPSIKMWAFNNDSKTFLPLEQKSYLKYLGVPIDPNLNWKYHIGHITSKISKTIGIIAGLRCYVPTSVLLTIYRSLLFSCLPYGILVWGQAAQSYLNQILV